MILVGRYRAHPVGEEGFHELEALLVRPAPRLRRRRDACTIESFTESSSVCRIAKLKPVSHLCRRRLRYYFRPRDE